MNLSKSNMKKILFIVTFAILLLVGLQNLPAVMGFVSWVFRLVMPFVMGLCIAFILNVPMRVIERVLFGEPDRPGRFRRKLRRPVSLVLTLLLVAGVVFIVLFLIIPELIRTFASMAQRVPPFLQQVQQWGEKFFGDHPEILEWMTKLELDWKVIANKAMELVQSGAGSVLNSTIGVATSIIGGVVNFFLGLVFAVYVLMQKERLGAQCRKVLFAYLPRHRAERVVSVCAVSHQTFSSFLSGQCLEAAILGMMFFITLSLFRFPYALIISVLTAFTALIPIFGAIIGCVVGALLILLVDPMQALWFIILFQILQQIEGNLIYPHVVGNSVGLPSIWVLVAVTIGGSMMGIAGMLIFIPLCSVLYALFREAVNRRLEKRALQPAVRENVHPEGDV